MGKENNGQSIETAFGLPPQVSSKQPSSADQNSQAGTEEEVDAGKPVETIESLREKLGEAEEKRRSFQSSESQAVNRANAAEAQVSTLTRQVQELIDNNQRIISQPQVEDETNDEPITMGAAKQMVADAMKDMAEKDQAESVKSKEQSERNAILKAVESKSDIKDVIAYMQNNQNITSDNEGALTNELGNYYRVKNNMLEQHIEQLTKDLEASKNKTGQQMIPTIGGVSLGESQNNGGQSELASVFNMRQQNMGF
jgi:hypothetical protein